MEKKKIWNILSVIFVAVITIALVLSIIRISELETQLDYLTVNHRDNILSMQNSINEIYENVDEKLKKQASILTNYNIEYSVIDTNNYTAPLLFTVTPKNTKDNTKVAVTIGNSKVNLQRKGNNFQGYIDAGVFVKDDIFPLVSVTADGVTQNEYLEDSMAELFRGYIPYLFADMTVREESFSNQKIRLLGDFALEYKPASEDSTIGYNQFFFIAEADSKEIFRKDITREAEAENSGYFQLEATISTPAEYTDLKYYLIAMDTIGLTHKKEVTTVYLNDGNSVTTRVEEDIQSYWIYGKKGELLYQEK